MIYEYWFFFSQIIITIFRVDNINGGMYERTVRADVAQPVGIILSSNPIASYPLQRAESSIIIFSCFPVCKHLEGSLTLWRRSSNDLVGRKGIKKATIYKYRATARKGGR
jgi:hypothetical protein